MAHCAGPGRLARNGGERRAGGHWEVARERRWELKRLPREGPWIAPGCALYRRALSCPKDPGDGMRYEAAGCSDNGDVTCFIRRLMAMGFEALPKRCMSRDLALACKAANKRQRRGN